MPVILAGVKEALRAVNTEDQISSRYRPEYLTKWKMDKDYISLLATTISKLPLKNNPLFSIRTMHKRFLSYATDILVRS